MCGMLDGMSTLSTKGGKMVNRMRHVLFPPHCLFCQQRMAEQNGCCADCLHEIHIWPHSVCRSCGKELPESMQPGPCGKCLQHAPAQDRTLSLYAYHGPVRDAILQWKLEGREAAVRWLVDAAMPEIRAQISAHDLLLPVPMPLSRMRKHGQHHAANLCRWLADGANAHWQWQLLRRIGEQPRQSALSGKARRRNLCKAFALSDDYSERLAAMGPKPERVWVVDDILTTGATLHYAAKAVRKLGLHVHVLSLARTSDRG